jgi:tRNA(fMet)-specific endonuclease VapC
MLLLDTSVVSAVMRRSDRVLARLREQDPSAVALCAPVAAEIQFGLSRLEAGSCRRELLVQQYRSLRGAVQWLEWTEEATTVFGSVKAALERRGTPLDDFDLIIGSIALSAGARLATRNARHFGRIDGLLVEDWEDEASPTASQRPTRPRRARGRSRASKRG